MAKNSIVQIALGVKFFQKSLTTAIPCKKGTSPNKANPNPPILQNIKYKILLNHKPCIFVIFISGRVIKIVKSKSYT